MSWQLKTCNYCHALTTKNMQLLSCPDFIDRQSLLRVGCEPFDYVVALVHRFSIYEKTRHLLLSALLDKILSVFFIEMNVMQSNVRSSALVYLSQYSPAKRAGIKHV